MFKEPPKNSREKTKNLLLTLQDKICSGLENIDGKGKFIEESWLRDEGGGGRSRVLKNGSIFEQAGVNFSLPSTFSSPEQILSCRVNKRFLVFSLEFLGGSFNMYLVNLEEKNFLVNYKFPFIISLRGSLLPII